MSSRVGEILGSPAKLVTPVIYAVSVLPGTFSIFLSIRIADYYLGLSEPVGLIASMLVGGIVFGCFTWGILRLERLRFPKVVDHVRHCAVFYALLMIVLLGALVIFSAGLTPGPGAAVAFAVLLSTGCAVSTNALVLFWQRQRSCHANSGSLS